MRGPQHRVAQLTAMLLALPPALAQQPAPGIMPWGAISVSDITAGSPAERILLNLMRADSANRFPHLRPMLRGDVEELLRTVSVSTGMAADGRSRFAIALPEIRTWYNSARAREDRDGGVWQGRGVTGSVTMGISGDLGPLSYSFRPLAFWSENRSFTPVGPTRPPGDYRDPLLATTAVDHPYRFGAEHYSRIEPGESWVAASAGGLAAGISTASQAWGPSDASPLVLGTGAGGIPRAFVEARSVPVGIGRFTAHWAVGRLEASPVSELPAGQRSRITTAVTANFEPGAFPGLSFGASRFFHVRWEPGIVRGSVVTLPFRGFFKRRNPTNETFLRDYNQLASVSARLAPWGSGVELYGEYYREDHSNDLRDLIVEADHASVYTIGLRRSWRDAARVNTIGVEFANGRISHLDRVRPQGSVYAHGKTEEGHTYLGQYLGAAAMPGGGGVVFEMSRAGRLGAWWVEAAINRTIQDEEGGRWNGRLNGWYVVRAGRSVVTKRGVYGVTAGIEPGFGWDRATNLALGASFRPLVQR